MTLVDTMLIGAQKSGTTTLAQQLGRHRAICLSREKEPGYFNEVEDWRSGLDSYHALFSPQPGQRCLEASTMYTFLPEYSRTYERIHAYNPDVKLLYVMRDPVERMLSNYAFRWVRRVTSAPPEVALLEEPSFVNRSRYAMQLRPYIERFGADQVHLMVFEEHIADTDTSLKQIAAFLGLDPEGYGSAEDVATHPTVGRARMSERGKKLKQHPVAGRAVEALPGPVRRLAGRRFRTTLEVKPAISDDLRDRLTRLVEDDVAQVERWLGRPVDAWGKRS